MFTTLAPSFDGKFSVQAAYHLDQFHRFLSHEVLTKQDWTLLWKLKIHEWLKLLQKLAWDTLSTRAVLKFRIPAIEEHYSTCQYPSESTIHLFLRCPILHRCGVWSSSLWSLPLCSNGFPNNGSSDQIHHMFRKKPLAHQWTIKSIYIILSNSLWSLIGSKEQIGFSKCSNRL